MRRIFILATAITFLATPVARHAMAEASSLEQVLVESATTPQAHAALAHYYEEKAAAARKDAEYHREMAKTYGGVKGSQVAAMKDHCDKLARLYDDQAKEFDSLAAMHRDMAK